MLDDKNYLRLNKVIVCVSVLRSIDLSTDHFIIYFFVINPFIYLLQSAFGTGFGPEVFTVGTDGKDEFGGWEDPDLEMDGFATHAVTGFCLWSHELASSSPRQFQSSPVPVLASSSPRQFWSSSRRRGVPRPMRRMHSCRLQLCPTVTKEHRMKISYRCSCNIPWEGSELRLDFLIWLKKFDRSLYRMFLRLCMRMRGWVYDAKHLHVNVCIYPLTWWIDFLRLHTEKNPFKNCCVSRWYTCVLRWYTCVSRWDTCVCWWFTCVCRLYPWKDRLLWVFRYKIC